MAAKSALRDFAAAASAPAKSGSHLLAARVMGNGKVLLLEERSGPNYTSYMKITDDRNAKFDLWAQTDLIPKANFIPLNIPAFRSRKFSSHEEFNEWKRSLRLRIAEQGGLKWKKS